LVRYRTLRFDPARGFLVTNSLRVANGIPAYKGLRDI
jgi:hypothetical protein